MEECQASLALHFDDNAFDDVQLWSKSPVALGDHPPGARYICHVKSEKIPFYLIASDPLSIYSNNDTTSAYFRDHLVKPVVAGQNAGLGLLVKLNENLYLVFYAHRLTIKALVIDFQKLDLLLGLPSSSDDKTCFVDLEDNHSDPTSTQDLLFDKVLQQRITSSSSSKGSTPLADPVTVSSQLLTTQDQVLQAVNKVVLSGLRIRGLSAKNTTISANERLTIKEIYQMTKKSTLFALHKYNYAFNQPAPQKHVVKLKEIQDIVEQLLEVFIDVDNKSLA